MVRRQTSYDAQNGQTNENNMVVQTPAKPQSPPRVPKLKPPPKKVPFREKIRSNRAYLVDVVARVFFPLSFGVFNIAFWCLFYLPSAEEYTYDS